MSTRTISKINLFYITTTRESFSAKFWRLVMKLYNRLSFGIFRCGSINDAKKHSITLLGMLSVALLPSLVIPMVAIYATIGKVNKY